MNGATGDPGLRQAFVAAFPIYVATWLGERGIDIDPVVADATVEGAAILDGLLTTLEATPHEQQRQSPLELFREALRPVGRALDTVGLEVPGADHVPRLAPWDRYGLSPGSSQVLGPEAHEAHLRWGLERVSRLVPARPTVGLFAQEGAAGPLQSAIERAGYDVDVLGAEGRVVVIDVGAVGAPDEIRSRSRRGAHVVAVGDTVDDLSKPGLLALGAAVVVDRQDFLSNPGKFLPTVA